ncbi:PspC domain-containing protein [Streptomyces kanasensis]|uniref:PspC domain-containing protein n=1 Tax=Streptomyces kanasensis TaxID=936756 RepID=UPI003822CF7F
MTSATPAPPEAPGAPPQHPPLRRTRRQKVVAGVCGGLGRHVDVDPVVFRVVTGVLAAAGGIGLIFYGFAWLAVPADGEDENEARRLLTGRVDGASLTAVLMALVGCGLFLSMLGANGDAIGFAILLACAAAGAAVWSQRRRHPEGLEPAAAAAAHAAGAEAPPETKAPPPPDAPSWWRDPIVKDGSTGPVPVGYLWGPVDGPPDDSPWYRPTRAARRERRSLGGPVLFLALSAGAAGTACTWVGHPLATALQTGLACALAVFALGLVVSAFVGRTGAGTVFLTVVTALLLAGASALPRQIGTDWTRVEWRPASVADVRPRYALGTGDGTLDLSALDVPAGRTVRVAAEAGAGRLAVTVPADATVRVHGHADLGDVRLPPAEPPAAPDGTGTGRAPTGQAGTGRGADDIDVGLDRDVTRTVAPPAGTVPGGTLVLDLRIAVGLVEVARAAR